MEDVIAWHYDNREIFTVRSTYKLQRELVSLRNCSTTQTSRQGGEGDERLWKGLWEIKCPGNIKIFMWKLAHNSISLRMGLERRGMELDTRCVMCGRLNEDGGHLFFQCKHVKQVWQGAFFTVDHTTLYHCWNMTSMKGSDG
jgi:hypothetical protein